jgi:biotin carboxylase
MQRTILLVGAGVMAEGYLRAAEVAGLAVVVVETPARCSVLRERFPGIVDGEPVDPDAAARDEAWVAPAMALAARVTPAAVLAFAEQHVLAAALVQHRLGLPGPGLDAATVSRNKALQRTEFARAALPQPEFHFVPALAATEQWALTRLPVVVKPLSLQGSAGVERIGTSAEWYDAVARRGSEGALLVEQYVDGPEYSVELLVRAGVVLFTNVTRKVTTGPPHFVELVHEAGPGAAGPALSAAAEVLARGVVAALRVHTGIVHLEFRDTGTGLTIMEVAVRTPGDHIMEIISRAHGIDLFAACISLALGEHPTLSVTDGPPRSAASVFLSADAAGTLAELDLSAWADLPGMVRFDARLAPGAAVRPAESSGDRLAYAVLESDGPAALQDLVATVHRTVRTLIEPTTIAARPERVLIVGGRLDNLRKAKDAGLGIVYLQQPVQFTGAHAALVDAAILVDYTDWAAVEPLVQSAHQAYGFSRAVSTTESGVEPAARINDALGLGGVSHRVARLLRDKRAMREHLADEPAMTVAAAEVAGRDSLTAFGAAHGYPFIIKPVDGLGSLGLQVVRAADGVDAAWERIQSLRGVEHQFSQFFPLDRFLMEQYIDGPEFSVEAFTFAGRHVIVAITEKLTFEDNFIELGHAMPARLDPESERAVERCVLRFLDVVGIPDGPSHTEVRLSAEGPKVIESHNRPGGDRIRDLVEEAYGFDIERYTVAWPSGVLPALPGRPAPTQSSATRFLRGQPGTVTAIDGLAKARSLPGVVEVVLDVSVGDTTHELRSSWDRVGQAIAVGTTTDEAIAVCEKAVAAIRIITAESDAPRSVEATS